MKDKRGIDGLVADATAAYESGKVKPIRGTYLCEKDGCQYGCMEGAAYVEKNGWPGNKFYDIPQFLRDEYGLDTIERTMVYMGFDGKAIYGGERNNPLWKAGRELSFKYIDQAPQMKEPPND